MLYTTLLTPYFLYRLLIRRRLKPVLVFFLLSIPIIYIHRGVGAEMGTYMKSYILFSSCVIFTAYAVLYLQKHKENLGFYFNRLVIINFFFNIIAIIGFFLPVLHDLCWYFVPLSPGLPVVPRLKMLVYEPSFYSLQLVPVFLYYFNSFITGKAGKYLLGLFLVLFSLILSLSFGVLGGLALSIVITLLFRIRSLLLRRKVFFSGVYAIVAIAALIAVILLVYPHNPIFERVYHIQQGWDTSANGRTWEAFMLAWRILQNTSYLIGAGLGQIKVAGEEIIINYYQYFGDQADIVRLPNAMAETLATFGFIGIIVRLFAEIGLFFYTRVYHNHYRLMLFCFIFIYQFTGSYLTNIYEYAIWLLAFLPVFPQFDQPTPHDEN